MEPLTGYTNTQAIPKANGDTTAHFLRERCAPIFGMVPNIHTDQGSHMLGPAMASLLKEWNSTHHLGTAYNPESQGAI